MVNEFLQEADLEHIKTHKYNTTGYSWLDNKMNPFWIKCATYLPHWLSPNMVTMIGLFALCLGVLIIIPFDIQISKPLNPLFYILFAVSLFLGQTFDAIDGKHARNTARSSPLGQLMDHGCDAFSNSFVVIMIAQAHLFGSTIYTVLIQVLVQLPFYIISWEEHHTGLLLTHINNMGVTEFQFIGMAVVLLPVFVGSTFSQVRFLGGYLSISELLVYLNGAA
jgi:phosphatidylglycerophosphate synthase